MAEKQQEWREREDERDDEERGDRYVKALERWLGDLPPAAERLARQQAAQWPRGDVALWHERRDAQQRTLDGRLGEIEFVDYKNVELLQRFINDQGKLLPRRITGVTA
ncbi:MAG: 30S ribosomal protein S18, partial [Burkholderiales bacterium]|nr:30S ribosomal protein S18 [Burkholderiales bacterium]